MSTCEHKEIEKMMATSEICLSSKGNEFFVHVDSIGPCKNCLTPLGYHNSESDFFQDRAKAEDVHKENLRRIGIWY